jgi:hypothetical protein
MRWLATIYYNHDSGPVDVSHDIEELDELAALVELGPNWYTITRIVIVPAEPVETTLLSGAGLLVFGRW